MDKEALARWDEIMDPHMEIARNPIASLKDGIIAGNIEKNTGANFVATFKHSNEEHQHLDVKYWINQAQKNDLLTYIELHSNRNRQPGPSIDEAIEYAKNTLKLAAVEEI